jgi:hypothetical protein
VEYAIRFLHDRCGVWFPDWTPYDAMIVLLAGLRFSDPNRSLDTQDVIQWFWRSSFSLAYDVASNTRLVADFMALAQSRDVQRVNNLVDSAVMLEATRKRQGALWRGMMCALAANGARDPGTGEQLRPTDKQRDIVVEVAFEEHRSTSVIPPVHLRAVNHILASRGTSRKMRSTDLASVLSSAVSERGREFTDELTRSQFLPSISDPVWTRGEWSEFAPVRLDGLQVFLQELTGFTFRTVAEGQ